jgi:hypothetical protein
LTDLRHARLISTCIYAYRNSNFCPRNVPMQI